MSALPYPHARNDCEMCRERDADVHVLGEQYNRPGQAAVAVVPALPGRACGAAGDQRERAGPRPAGHCDRRRRARPPVT